jgi:hypothetical protein
VPKPYIRVQLGRIAYEVRGRDAFNTCANSFAYARKQAALDSISQRTQPVSAAP